MSYGYGPSEYTAGTFTPRTAKKGFVFDLMEGFMHMQQLGADVVEAAMACVTGHRMTPDLAAMCLQTYWRRYTSIANYQESRGAAITVQAAFRGMGGRTEAQGEQEAMDQALMDAGLIARPNNDEDLYAHKSVTKLQAVWRGHLARQFVDKLRWQSKSKLQRTFSWSKKNKKKPAAGVKGIQDRSAKDILAAAGVDSNKPKKVQRSMSFARFSSGVKSIISSNSDEKDSSAPSPAKSKQLLFILLQRGPNGLGLELDATNTVVNLVPGGAADTQGYFREGDTIASCDGIPLRGRLLQDVMDRSKNSYSFDVWRLTPVEPEPEKPKALNPVRRAFSFDRKKR